MQKNALISRVIFFSAVASSLLLAGIVVAKTLPVFVEQETNQNTKVEQAIPNVTETVTAAPTNPISIPTKTVPVLNTPTPNNDTRCIVTIFGQKYDVTFLRDTHSGGDVFICNTDMSTIYQRRHGTNLNLIARYLIGSSGTAPNPQSTPGRGEREDDD